jgi:hypothetical protein
MPFTLRAVFFMKQNNIAYSELLNELEKKVWFFKDDIERRFLVKKIRKLDLNKSVKKTPADVYKDIHSLSEDKQDESFQESATIESFEEIINTTCIPFLKGIEEPVLRLITFWKLCDFIWKIYYPKEKKQIDEWLVIQLGRLYNEKFPHEKSQLDYV